MLSIETPPGPPCPCKAPALRTDERASDQLALQEGDPEGLGETQTPNFSIRDYVFTSRSNGVATNWPFPQQFLQLCLQHGVRDVLPPFEPPDSLRTRCCRKDIESEQLVACSGDEKVPSQVESVEIEDVGLVDKEPRKALYPLLEEAKQTVDQGDTLVDESIEGNAEIFSAVINPDQIEIFSEQISERHCAVQVTRSVSEASSEVEVAEPHPFPSTLEVLRDPAEKKCRLIVKSGAVTETSRVEDIVSTSSTVSDSMASKVCPVCKTFASTSNTTLNAHIDQCLSTESNTKWLVSEIPKPKGKPRKKRLMVDIYATAAHCTLEDLDRRNGTNWATELAWVAPTNEAYTEIKRPKLSPVVTRDDGNEEAVYVDSNGIKLRILSKFNDTPPSLTRENFKLKKHAKDIKEGESLLAGKKNCFGSKYSKYMKVKPQTKKLSSFNLFNGEIQAAPGGNHHANTHQEKEVSPLEMSNDHESVNIGTSATLRNWVCSKRSDLPKRLNHKDIHNLGNSVLKTTRNLLTENNPTDVANSSVVKHDILKFSRPPEDMASSPKVKSVDFLSSSIPIMDNGKKKSPKPSVVNSKWSSDSASTNHLTLKIPRSLETSISSPRCQSDEIDKITVRTSNNFSITTMKPSKSCHPSLKTKRSSTMKNCALVRRRSCLLLEQSECDAIGQPSTSKKFRKQRSILGAGKQGELPFDVNEGLCRSIKHCGISTPRTGKKFRTHRSDLSENFKWSRTEVTMGHLSPSRSNIPESEGKDASTIEKPKYTSLKQWHPWIEGHDPQMASSTGKTGGDPVYSETAISKSLAPTSSAKLDPRPPVEEFVYSVCGSEAHLEPMAENLCGGQEIQFSHVAHDEVVSQSIQVTDEVEFRTEAETYAAHNTKCQAETTSVQESSACLTSHGDAVLEVPRENSSVTSIRMASDLDQNLAIDRERQGSPVSTASTISPRSPKHPESKDPEAEPMMRHTVQSRAGFAMVPCSANIDRTEGRNKERRNEEAEAFPLAKEPEKFSDDHPCCCSWREGLPRESQFSRHNVMAGTMLQSKGMQISSLNIVPSVSSSFSSYPSLRADAKVVPILESPTGSITTKASTESAVTAPACIDFSSPSPSPRTPANSTSSSILRLMGKNLMVANKEEFQLPTVHHSAFETPSNTKCSSPPFASTGWESFSYHRQQLPCGSAFFGRAPSMVNQHFALHSNDIQVGGSASPFQAGLKMKPDHPIHREFSKKPSAPSASNVDRISAPHPHHQKPPSSSEADTMREVIVIDDSPEFEAEHKYTPVVGTWPSIPLPNPMQHRPFPCFPSQGPFVSRGYANTAKRGKASEVSDPLLQRPLVFQSPPTGHLKPPVYYFQTLR